MRKIQFILFILPVLYYNDARIRVILYFMNNYKRRYML